MLLLYLLELCAGDIQRVGSFSEHMHEVPVSGIHSQQIVAGRWQDWPLILF